MSQKTKQTVMFARGEDTPLFSGVAARAPASASASQDPDPAGGQQAPLPVGCLCCRDTGQVGSVRGPMARSTFCWCRAGDRLRHSKRKRRPAMQVAIEGILKGQELLDSYQDDPGFYVKLEQDPCQPLIIERLSTTDQVSIAHTYIQQGDVMWDPMIVFDLPTWEPVQIDQSPLGGHFSRRFRTGSDGRELVNTSFRPNVMPLVRMWARNLRFQGWESARVARLLTRDKAEV